MENKEARVLLEEIGKVQFRRSPIVAQSLQDITRVVQSGADLSPKQAKIIRAIHRDVIEGLLGGQADAC